MNILRKLGLRLFSFLIFTGLTGAIHAQAPLERVSKDKTFSLSTTYIFRNDFDNLASGGIGGSFEFSYKISGYHKKSPVYLMVPLEYNYYPGTDELKAINILSYGWSLRHHLGRGKKIVPFVDYSLMLSQLRIEETAGYLIGHQTRFGAGINIKPERDRLRGFLKLEYGYHNYPEFGVEETKHLHTFVIRAGIRILKYNRVESRV